MDHPVQAKNYGIVKNFHGNNHNNLSDLYSHVNTIHLTIQLHRDEEGTTHFPREAQF